MVTRSFTYSVNRDCFVPICETMKDNSHTGPTSIKNKEQQHGKEYNRIFRSVLDKKESEIDKCSVFSSISTDENIQIFTFTVSVLNIRMIQTLQYIKV